MNDPENFLARWSRRKSEIAAGESEAGPQDASATAAPATPAPDQLEDEMASLASPEDTPPAPLFDPASLPSLDSIGADTDIRGFLAPGVPTELAHAALRRVWTADPGIRDFKGLAENDWDFTAPGSMLGFGELAPGTDVERMLADVFGELMPDAGLPTASIASDAPTSATSAPEFSTVTEPLEAEPEKIVEEMSAELERVGDRQQQDDLLHRNANAALQNNGSIDVAEHTAPRRQHGSALPQ